MNGRQKERKVLGGEKALRLARQGDIVWNKWAEDNPGSEVDFSGVSFRREQIAFAGFVFPGPVNFQSARFRHAGFRRAKFRGDDTNFDKAEFDGLAGNFQEAEFSGGGVSFIEATFLDGGADFRGAKFIGGPANFIRARFNGRETNFEGAVFSVGAMFDRAKFEKGTANFSKAKFRGGDASFGWAIFAGGDANFNETEFSDGCADFGAAEFKGGAADFYNAKFSGGATIFAQAEFSGGNTCFMSTEFGGEEADFGGAKFSGGRVEFNGAVFSGAARFEGGTFDSPVDLEGARFKQVPDFRRTILTAHFTLHDVTVEPGHDVSGVDADRYRRLKQLAVESRDHKSELYFFSRELMAMRGHETLGLALWLDHLYELTSDFGRSLARPIFFLVATWFVFGLVYATLFGKTGMGVKGFVYSAMQLFPFLPGSRHHLKELEDTLFTKSLPDSVSDAVFALSMIEGVLGFIFLFLIGLALRNRFRI